MCYRRPVSAAAPDNRSLWYHPSCDASSPTESLSRPRIVSMSVYYVSSDVSVVHHLHLLRTTFKNHPSKKYNNNIVCYIPLSKTSTIRDDIVSFFGAQDRKNFDINLTTILISCVVAGKMRKWRKMTMSDTENKGMTRDTKWKACVSCINPAEIPCDVKITNFFQCTCYVC